MQEKRFRRLKDVMSVQSCTYRTERMNKYIIKYIMNIGGCTIKEDQGNIYVTKGQSDAYPCIVSHTDTVHKIIPNDHYQIYNTPDKTAMFAFNTDAMKPTGIGGDDKVGIFVALESLRELDTCKAVFFRDEEHGCLGSAEADMSFFDDVAYALQCDRQGYKDVVTDIYTTLCSDAFMADISDLVDFYGREFSTLGGITDVGELADKGIPVSVINMSCGYYRPHSDNEWIDVNEVKLTLEFVLGIINTLGETKYPIVRHEKKKYKYGGKYGEYSSYNDDAWDDYYQLPDRKKYSGVAEDYEDGEDLNDVVCPHCLTDTTMEWLPELHDHQCNTCYALLDGNEAVPYSEIDFDDDGLLIYKNGEKRKFLYEDDDIIEYDDDGVIISGRSFKEE